MMKIIQKLLILMLTSLTLSASHRDGIRMKSKAR